MTEPPAKPVTMLGRLRPWVLIRGHLAWITYGLTEEQKREARRSRHNERVKSFAALLNSLATGIATAGIVGPIVAVLLKHPEAPISQFTLSPEAIAFMAIWSLLGLGLHIAAQAALGLLR